MEQTELKLLIKECLSIISTATLKDNEIQMWIDAGKEDLKRMGIEIKDENNALIRSAIVMFVKSNFGNVDIKEKELSHKTYNLLATQLSLTKEFNIKEGESNV